MTNTKEVSLEPGNSTSISASAESTIPQRLQQLSDVIEYDKSHVIENKELGSVFIDKGHIGKNGYGLLHIIDNRTKEGRPIDETAAILHLVARSSEEGNITRKITDKNDPDKVQRVELEKNGIVALVSLYRFQNEEKWLLTGFDDRNKKEETTEAIQAVIAQYSYTPEFSCFRKQVGAVVSSLQQVSHQINEKSIADTWNENNPHSPMQFGEPPYPIGSSEHRAKQLQHLEEVTIAGLKSTGEWPKDREADKSANIQEGKWHRNEADGSEILAHKFENTTAYFKIETRSFYGEDAGLSFFPDKQNMELVEKATSKIPMPDHVLPGFEKPGKELAKEVVDSTLRYCGDLTFSDAKQYFNIKADSLKMQHNHHIADAKEAGYVLGVCECAVIVSCDKKMSKKLLSEMKVTKEMARKYVDPETYKTLEKTIFAQKHERKRETGVKR